jgi:hypothetical protein
MKYCNNNKLRRIELAGHMVRMSNKRAVKRPDGRRKAGRPKQRWLDSIANNLKSMAVKRWRNKQKTDSCGLSF